MQKMFRTLIVFVLMAFVASMAMASDAPVQIGTKATAVVKRLTKTVPPPQGAGKDALAAEVSLTYPEFTAPDGKNPAVEALNKAVQSRLFALLEGKTVTTTDELMKAFADDFEKTMKEQPDMPGAWSMKFEVTIKHADEELVSLEVLESMFLGGAHPNSNITYLVFSMKTGQQLGLADLVAADKLSQLTAVAEKEFRKVRALKADETYEQAGFQFDGNRFALNKNFLLSPAGLGFCFNAYEIAPYAMGITEMTIPWADLKGIVTEKSPAAVFLK